MEPVVMVHMDMGMDTDGAMAINNKDGDKITM